MEGNDGNNRVRGDVPRGTDDVRNGKKHEKYACAYVIVFFFWIVWPRKQARRIFTQTARDRRRSHRVKRSNKTEPGNPKNTEDPLARAQGGGRPCHPTSGRSSRLVNPVNVPGAQRFLLFPNLTSVCKQISCYVPFVKNTVLFTNIDST